MSALESKPIQNNTTGTMTMPTWLTDLAKTTATGAAGIANKGYQAFPGANPYGGTSADTQSGFQKIRDLFAGSNGTSAAISNVMNGAAPKVATEGTFDGEGIDKYMSKYTEGALNPALAKIAEAANAARLRARAGATSSGAFGDARHGVVENGINANESDSIGSTAGTFMNQAFGQAVGARQNDLGRKLNADQTTASLGAQRDGMTLNAAGQLDNQQNNRIRQLLGAGEYQDTRGTAADQFNYGQYTEGRDWDKNQQSWLMQMLQGTPTDKTSTGTSEQTGGPSPWMALLGGLAQGVGSKV